MNSLLPFGERRMTVREVAEALGYDPRTIQLKVKELFPDLVKERETTYLDEAQVTAVKMACEKRFAATTELEMAMKTIEVITYMQRRISEQAAQIADLEPRAAVADRIASAEGSKPLSEIGKINGIGPRKIFEVLADRKIIFRRGRSWLPYQEYIDAGLFRVVEASYGPDDGQHLYTQTYVTGKGEVWLAKQLFPRVAP